jgi:hypothetical protein
MQTSNPEMTYGKPEELAWRLFTTVNIGGPKSSLISLGYLLSVQLPLSFVRLL